MVTADGLHDRDNTRKPLRLLEHHNTQVAPEQQEPEPQPEPEPEKEPEEAKLSTSAAAAAMSGTGVQETMFSHDVCMTSAEPWSPGDRVSRTFFIISAV
ncbi:hypothetical protein RRG08_008544 [Elysia crispata]|uniref:Uncharacterized protein n=1 Tax=Elysia crispata TaxID=231223 RepID=A0AAE1CXJ4_9GAST|nr:hypothetical protein RRG08_008544 [Elysia crispata]